MLATTCNCESDGKEKRIGPRGGASHQGIKAKDNNQRHEQMRQVSIGELKLMAFAYQGGSRSGPKAKSQKPKAKTGFMRAAIVNCAEVEDGSPEWEDDASLSLQT